MAESSTKSIRVHILGREYALRVEEEDEEHTRTMAAFVNRRMEAFKDAHPEQAELTTAVITALALADELHQMRDSATADTEHVTSELRRLAETLSDVIEEKASPPERSEESVDTPALAMGAAQGTPVDEEQSETPPSEQGE
ncbi:cell division protein ZapA [Longibacter salinarum]|uniref:Cell division protein ZapA n=1 Tax=Longibacter salinarum TaxID=1850348 RepID=A0A2A8CUR1_9BACT|nr:cell division protein ZapA [Longibacter salinarum]PEN11281.1 cell division protein ZapA [Longibacter salinarum]